MANELILKDSRADLYLGTFYAALELEIGRLSFENAGHNRPLLCKAESGQIAELLADGVFVGAFSEISLSLKSNSP